MDTNLLFTFCSLTVAFVNAVSLSYIRQALRLLSVYLRCGKQKASDRDGHVKIGDLGSYKPDRDIAPAEKARV